VSPILIRPVREQLEHDRLIRHLATKYKKKFEVSANVGDEQVAPVKIGALTLYPDLVWMDGKRLAGVAEVETGESVNNLEAMAQWVHFSRARVPFHLYVPVQGYDATRRLCDANQAKVTEIWTYRASLDGFDLVKVYTDSSQPPVVVKKPPVKVPPAAPARPTAPAKSVATKPMRSVARTKPSAKAAKAAARNGKPTPARGAKAKPHPRKNTSKVAPRKAASPKKKGGVVRGR